MQIARLYLRVSTDEQDRARQADIEHSARPGRLLPRWRSIARRRPAHALTRSWPGWIWSDGIFWGSGVHPLPTGSSLPGFDRELPHSSNWIDGVACLRIRRIVRSMLILRTLLHQPPVFHALLNRGYERTTSAQTRFPSSARLAVESSITAELHGSARKVANFNS